MNPGILIAEVIDSVSSFAENNLERARYIDFIERLYEVETIDDLGKVIIYLGKIYTSPPDNVINISPFLDP